MMDNKYIPVADQSWSEAEKMLDKHFKKKRMIVIFFSIVIPSLIVGISLMIGHSKKISENNIVSSVQTTVSSTTSIENSETLNNTLKSEENNSVKSNTNSNQPVPVQINKHNKSNKSDLQNDLSASTNSGENKSVSNRTYLQSENIPGSKNSSELNSNSYNHREEQSPFAGNKSYSNENNPETIALLNPVFASTEYNSTLYYLNEGFNTHLGKDPGVSKIGWEATLYGGVNYIQKNLSVDNDWNNYLMHRKNEEEPVVAPFVGMSISGNINSLGFNFGLEFSQYGEKTNYYPYSNQSTYITNSDWLFYQRSIVDTDTAYVIGNQLLFETTYLRLDSSYVTITDTIEEYKYDQKIAETNGPTRIYYVEMPIEVSYRVSKGKLGLGFSGGISPAMRVQENGYYLRPDGRGVESLSEMKTFRTFLFNARLSVDLFYRAGDRINLVLRPQFRTNLNSVFKDDYGVNQKYYTSGVLFGVSYMLN
jgi:hypothetical protein